MAVSVGSLLGLILGAALLGALIAWILRKIVPMPTVRSYAIGVSVSTLAYMLFSNELYLNHGSTAGIVLGALCGVAAFALLCLTTRSVGD